MHTCIHVLFQITKMCTYNWQGISLLLSPSMACPLRIRKTGESSYSTKFYSLSLNQCIIPALFSNTTIPVLLTLNTLCTMCLPFTCFGFKTPSIDCRPSTLCKLKEKKDGITYLEQGIVKQCLCTFDQFTGGPRLMQGHPVTVWMIISVALVSELYNSQWVFHCQSEMTCFPAQQWGNNHCQNRWQVWWTHSKKLTRACVSSMNLNYVYLK